LSHTVTEMKIDLQEKLNIPTKVEVSITDGLVTVKGEKGTVQRTLYAPNVGIEVKDGAVLFSAKKATKREKRLLYTFKAHLNNLLKGVNDPHVYKLKICSGHFPMNITYTNNQLSIKNFLGEKVPRTYTVPQGVTLKIDGQIIRVESVNKELAGQVAGALEQLTRITNRDRRIFQDGLYLIEKAGKEQK